MGFFKKAIAKHKEKKAARKEKRRTRSNAGDRRKQRVAERREHRKAKKHDKHAMKLEKLALKQAGKKSTWGTIMEKVGPVANQYLSVQQDDGSYDEGFVNEDGTVTSALTNKTYTPPPTADVSISDDAAQDVQEAGGAVDTYDYKPKSKLGISITTDKGTTTLTNDKGEKVAYSWKKMDGETTMGMIKRWYTDKPVVMWTSTITVVGLVTWGFIAGIKKYKKTKMTNKRVSI